MWQWRSSSFLRILACLILPQYTISHPLYGSKSGKSSNSSGSLAFSHYYSGARLLNLPSSVDTQQLGKWTSTALKFFDFHRCVISNIASSEDECFRLNQIQREAIRVYFASAGNTNPQQFLQASGKSDTNPRKKEQKIVAIFPDSNTPKGGGVHDALLVLDPYPLTNFGHLVAVFYIDFGVDSKKCKEDFQIYTTDETCITVAKKPRCPNRLERYTGGGLQPRRCHIDFLPTVYPAERFMTSVSSSSSSAAALGSSSSSATESDSNNSPLEDVNGSGNHLTRDLLDCVNLPGFANCPTLRPLDDRRKVLCDASAVNSKRCDTSHAGVGTRCKLFQTCDRAVLVGGGWNRLHSDLKSFENVVKMQESLSSLGFLPENIKTFYANGKAKRRPSHVASQFFGTRGKSLSDLYDESSFFSSAMKTGLRGHIRTICETRHCADTLYIYLNNPTTIEGDMLLWDVDYNGMVDELEVYTVKEFLSDLVGCEARRVLIIADQSNSDILLSNLKESNEHKNVLLYTAGLPNQQTTNGEFTELWAKHSRSSSCIRHVHQHVKNGMVNSIPVDFDSTSGVPSRVSLIGAPCDLIPPVNSRELKSLYEGCQNVPTSVWFSASFDDVGGGTDYDLNGGTSGLDESEENLPNGRRS